MDSTTPPPPNANIEAIDAISPEPPTAVSTARVLRTVQDRFITWDEKPSSLMSKSWDYELVWIDVWKLDALLPLASNMKHVRFAGEDGIRGKYKRFDDFVRSQKNKKLLMPEAEIERACRGHADRDIVYLYNGRHRFAWMRDHGAQALPVVVLKSEAHEIAKLVGTDLRVCRVTMRTIPEWICPELSDLAL